MEFRWVAFIALWTLLSGPAIGTPTGTAARKGAAERSAKLLPTKAPAVR